MLHELIELRGGGKYGTGHKSLFAKEDMPAGTSVWWYGEDDVPLFCFSRKQIQAHPQRDTLCRFSYMLGHDLYGVTPQPAEDPAWHFNHSCDGNCWYDGDDRVVTKRRVAAGEELTYDYGLTETEASMHAGMACLCGSAHCRGVLGFSEYRDPDWVAANAGHTSSYIAAKCREVGWHHPGVAPGRKLPPSAGDGKEPPATPEAYEAAKAAVDSGVVALGLFALRPLLRGEVLLYFGGKVLGRHEVLKVQRRLPTMHFIQVAPALWMVPIPGAGSESPDYINHSCDPCCGMLDSVTVVAMRDISEGEELCIDYGTVMDESIEDTGLETFDCTCSAANCRRRVTPRDYLLPSVREKCEDFFPPYMRAKLVESVGGSRVVPPA
ncbi:hypothetical protein CHLRE_08g370200v5 [Chlamydomonas reinhardtii]|uniref:SET domain-containing protein n=1 Tax=Chlamydomonas reinhardtii TaxID=3055 RepID=A0A2K3DH89_CHLRE|nr:uncharacterized protein CHLRE_08g370200v5 [Chlamydomonas reinhardtii]XP_042922018.1 uncharacterized protein CHLRE_08g370200v5 [Chlamydomonas reinhardtii]PNW79876.1 hypothetical protein CHLRE_08g370200v5 [Chlamydomonas reinhardtii]PNW79877.1 hypothetical protein CHLRE_08g370200v5 [Chlamydomonas reinhardtii]